MGPNLTVRERPGLVTDQNSVVIVPVIGGRGPVDLVLIATIVAANAEHHRIRYYEAVPSSQ